jgi:hypothetical protein
MPSRKVRPEQLSWNLVEDLVITASGNYFAFDTDGNVFLDFKTVEGDSFSIKNQGTDLFAVFDDGRIIMSNSLNVGKDVFISGSIYIAGGASISGSVFSGSTSNALTASHLEEQGVSYYSPISTPVFISGGFWRSSSGDWFVS